ncbi:MAG: hypothetical protein EXS05_09545 [Planctomycetaceae bacterium]|nr:hypothetical protein [Planctomycetaceae bacterium]
MKPDEPRWDLDREEDEQFSALLQAANHDMPPPDPEFLKRLRDATTQAFLGGASGEADGREEPKGDAMPSMTATGRDASITGSTADPTPGDRPPANRSSPASLRGGLTRLVAASAAMVAVAAVVYWLVTPPQPAVALTLSAALDRTAAAETLHLTLNRDGEAHDVWLAQPGLLRVDNADGTYEIARDDTLWRIDERENRAAAEPLSAERRAGDSSRGVLYNLLGVDLDAGALAAIGKSGAEVIDHEGQALYRYRVAVSPTERRLHVEALVDARTQILQSLVVAAEHDGRLTPVVELNVVAVNQPVAAEKFVVSDTLTEDGRVGKVTDVQGIVAIRPVMHQRWTPVCGSLPLKPGDWVRTDVRGANAVALRLVKQTTLLVGPGSLLEVVSPTKVRLHSGELEATVPENEALELLGPGNQKFAAAGRQLYRVRGQKLAPFDRDPLWLGYFKGTTNNESLGSLLALVDGRNVPLTVGYHKVQVDIRDQIARTVIEESFVNRTDLELEGVFHFPLPADASISGFGMWIGDELVEADVVEKQRAREIYETILREKRDPGLLEWEGGNLFKARVYPIPAHAEKRIKISYTQVLPARGNAYRYSYALQSDLLKLHPLRELSLNVKVASATPLKNVTSPTHTVRVDKTARSAHLEFTAQEYVPTRDFEVVVETDARQSEVVLIPHRRGDDGYFMLQLTPPSTGVWQREIVPDSEPIELLILADTSTSMESGQRKSQAELVAALLGALTPRDTINLAGCDVECDWVFETSRAAEPGNLAAARDFLEKRHSLGWTDLDKAFAAAFKRCGPRTHVIYIGDGVTTIGDGSPDDFVRRLGRLHAGVAGACHAIAVGSSFESVVLQGIAALGGGSVRRVSGEQGPPTIALELLREIAQPGLRDLKVEFHGLRTARVYPERLPGLPAGSQQILLGLYQPDVAVKDVAAAGSDQAGEVVVTGTQGGRPVKFSAKVSLKNAEAGNSFIPRLWARLHLESLLAQGSATAIKDEVITMSEEFQIMTPYTSFLVLETDADRERFGVKRRFRIRDGEKYFQEGRDTVNYELVQQQMRRASNWRLGLRRSVLRELALLGRSPVAVQPWETFNGRSQANYYFLSDGAVRTASAGGFGGGYGGPASESGGELGDRWNSFGRLAETELGQVDVLGFDDATKGERDEITLLRTMSGLADSENFEEERSGLEAKEKLGGLRGSMGIDLAEDEDSVSQFGAMPLFDGAVEFNGLMGDLKSVRGLMLAYKPRSPGFDWMNEPRGGDGEAAFRMDGRLRRSDARYATLDSIQFMQQLFPQLPSPPSGRPTPELKPTWPEEALTLSQSLLRTGPLAKMEGGLEIVRNSESFDPRWNELKHQSRTRMLYSSTAWLTRTASDWSQTLVNWCDANERGVFGLAFQLGRTRKSAPAELTPAILEQSDYSLSPLHEAYRNYVPSIVPQEAGRVRLSLSVSPKHETHVLIDTQRHVILAIETRYDGKVQSATAFDDFVEVGGSWWACKIESTDDRVRRTSLVTQTVAALAADQFVDRMKDELRERDAVQLIPQPLPTLAQAKRALSRAGEVTYDVELTLLLHFAQSQQWTRVFEHLDRSEKLAAGKPGVRWVRDALLQAGRRHEGLKPSLREEASSLPAMAGTDRQFLANHLVQQGASILEANEMLAFLDVLKPIYAAQPPHVRALQRWGQHHVGYLDATGQAEPALNERRQLAVDNPHDADEQVRYAQALYNSGDFDAGYAWIEQVLGGDARWRDDEEQRLRNTVTQFLQQEGRYADLVAYMARWALRDPEGSAVYQQYLSALYQNDQIDDADGLVARWLTAGRVARDLPAAVGAKLTAAIQLALGQGYNVNLDRVDEKWHVPLSDVALFYAQEGENFHPADLILGHWRFQSTDEARKARKTIGVWLAEQVETMPLIRLQRSIGWTISDGDAVDEATWKRIAATLEDRWAGEKDLDARDRLAQSIVQILSSKMGTAGPLDFLRRQLREGPPEHRAAYASQLFNTLLGQPWSIEFETELFSLLEQLSDAEQADERLLVEVSALQRLTDLMVTGRNTAGLAKIEGMEKLTRTEQAANKAEQLRLAREGAADRLAAELKQRVGALLQWIDVERLTLEVQAGRNLPRAFEECREFLDVPAAKRQAPAEDAQGKAVVTSNELPGTVALERMLQQRWLSIVAYIATRKNADPAQADRTLKYIDQQIADPAGNDKVADENLDDLWKLWKYRLLIALDRPDDLQTALKAWIQGDDPLNRWRLSLGYLLAERGAVPEAIGLFEGVEVADALDPQAYQALSGWYLAANRRADYERAQRRIYMTMDEWRMNQWLQQQLYPWQRSDQPLPSELDGQVLLMFAALFEKSGSPENYLWSLQQFYQATRDFRLLAVVADAVTGRTALRAYPFLQGLRSVLGEIRDEATADELVQHIAKVREQTTSAVDQRALDLLEVLVERRAAEVQNQAGPHVDRALAALERAFRREWAPGEQRLMADYLANLGGITPKSLAAEQLREMQVLYDGQTPGTFDRLHICMRRAELISYHGRPDRAIDLLENGLSEFRQSHGGRLPAIANEAMAKFLSFLESARHYARAEQVVAGELAHPTSGQQRLWLTQKMYEVYHEALRNDGTVSVGSGLKLFLAFEATMQADLGTGDQNHRYQVLNLLCGVYRTAHDKKINEADESLRTFATRVVLEVLKRQTNNYQSVVNQVANTVHDLLGPRDGLAFLLDCFEQEPRWLRYQNYDSWSQHAYTLSCWRTEVKDLSDLQPRLLKVVLAELRRDLETSQARNRSLYHAGHNYFWKEQTEVFAEVAEEVLKQRNQSGPAVLYIAEYLWHGLQREDQAIEALFIAHRQKLLDEGGQSRLIDWLHQKQRFGESIALLEPLIEEHPGGLQYRLWLMQAFFHTKRPAEMRATLERADAWFHEKDQWTEGVLAGLAAMCLETQLYEACVSYYDELIPRHQQSQPNRGIGNGTLSGYYANLAMAHAGLKQTAAAVDAAGSAIVSWGSDVRNRDSALTTLRAVLAQSPDLPAYIANLDQETSATGDDMPIVRKALGQVLLDQGQAELAIVQLQRALAYSSNDLEIHQALLRSFDALKDKAAAIAQLLRTIDLTRRDLKLYQQLAGRYSDFEQSREAERAWTAMIDALPAEAESHSLLAEARQQQDRWDEAIEQWQQVVRLRALEPTGLQKLAAAQIHQKQWAAASQTIRKLETTGWPGRFADADHLARLLRQQWEAARGQ